MCGDLCSKFWWLSIWGKVLRASLGWSTGFYRVDKARGHDYLEWPSASLIERDGGGVNRKKKICEGYCLAEHSLYCNNCAVLPRVLQYDFHSDIFAVQLVNSSLTLYRICFVCILRNLHHVHCFGGKVWGIDHFSTMWLLWGEPSKANFNLKCLLPLFILINIASNITIIANDAQCLLGLINCWVVELWLYGLQQWENIKQGSSTSACSWLFAQLE